MKVFILFSVLICGVLCDIKDGGKAPRLPLNDGHSIPTLGLGTFLGFDDNGQKEVLEKEVENAVTWGLNAGYRLIDTAALYKDEDQIGQAVLKTDVPRENIFIVTKLAINAQRDVLGSLKQSLERLNQTYVDLYLIHFPVALSADFSSFDIIDYVDTWREMEKAKEQGLARSIGISNFNVTQIERLLANCNVKPAVLQVEVNLNLAQNQLIDFCKSKDITVMAYSPFGHLFSTSLEPPAPRANDPKLKEIAGKYSKTVPQIVLRYLVQRGVVPIPKSVRKERIEENINVFDFKLTQEEMDELSKFNANYRVVHPSFWQDHPYYPFEKKDVKDPNLFDKKPKQ